MKKIIIIFFLFFLLFTIESHAHSGRTDGSGGHTNHTTGEYHYHHGYPEHQHPGGVCPYLNATELDTSQNDDSSANSQNSNTTNNSSSPEDVEILIGCCIFWLTIFGICKTGIDSWLNNKKK